MVTALKTSTSDLSRWSTGPMAACPICGSGEPVVFDDTRPQTMLICRSCRHLFWDRTPTPDELHKHYAEQYSEQHDQQAIQQSIRDYYRSHVAELARLLGKPPADLCLVDYGSSIPVLVHEATAAGFGRAVAVDYDAASFAYAREHGLEIVTPPEYERWPDAAADVVRFSHVLEHMPDPVAAVATAVAKLRPGGLLYITQPSFPLYRPATTRHRLRDSVYPTHLHFFTPLSLRRLVERFPVRVTHFLTHSLADETMRQTADALDLDHARAHLADWAEIGEPVRGELCNFPYYAGANSELRAFKGD
jgi:SAM-dependent methyltransferase